MKTILMISTLAATLVLAACDRPTTVVTPAPASTVAVPVPVPVPGPPGAQGEPGKPGSTNVIVVPQAASEPK